jgi:serine phosphatase RsbU (regulator of sigma subunit)
LGTDEERLPSRRAVRVVAIALAVLVVVVYVLSWARVANGTAIGFDVYPSAAPADGLTAVYVDPMLDLRTGDRIVAVDGVSAAAGAAFHDAFWRPRKPGEPMDLRVQRAADAPDGGSVVALSVVHHAPLAGAAAIIVELTQSIGGLLFLAVAVVVALIRPREPAVWPLLLGGGGISLAMSRSIWNLVPSPEWYVHGRVGPFLSVVAFAGLFHVCLILSGRRLVLSRRGWRAGVGVRGTLALVYALQLGLAVVLLSGPPETWGPGALLCYLIQIGASAGVLLLGYRRHATPLTRAQIKWIAWALVVMTGSTLVSAIEGQGTGGAYSLLVGVITNASGWLLPIALGFSVLRYRLFDVDRVLRATIVYGALTTLLVVGYLGLAFLLSRVAAGMGLAADTTAGVASVLVMSAVAQPLRTRVQNGLELLVYRDRVALRLFRAYAADLLGRAQPADAVAAFLTTQAAERLRLTDAWLVVRADPFADGAAEPQLAGAASAGAPPAAPLLERLRQLDEPAILSREELMASGLTTIGPNDPVLATWYEVGARFLFPLRLDATGTVARPRDAGPAPESLLAIWVLGVSQSGTLFDRTDLRALGGIARQAAVLLDHARLAREQVAQELLRRDLTQAREVQELLLPPNPPQWPGLLEIAVRYHPARAISGDFYDVVPLSTGSDVDATAPTPPLLIAVADVMGKGIAAALVMALVRGLVRSVVAGVVRAQPPSPVPLAVGPSDGVWSADGGPPPLPPSPADALRQVAGLLHRDVGRRVFVACALATVEATGREDLPIRMRLANAGQIQPLLCRDGLVLELEPPGERLPLGILSHPVYLELTVDLHLGDTIVFASDGLPEAPAAGGDGAGEFFGFERLAASVGRRAAARSAEQVAAGIWEDVAAWSGDEPQHDDMTLVVLKVQAPARLADAGSRPALVL